MDGYVGDRLQGRSITIGKWHVLTFPGLLGDYFTLHAKEEYAAAKRPNGMIAHGLLTFVVGPWCLPNELSPDARLCSMWRSAARGGGRLDVSRLPLHFR